MYTEQFFWKNLRFYLTSIYCNLYNFLKISNLMGFFILITINQKFIFDVISISTYYRSFEYTLRFNKSSGEQIDLNILFCMILRCLKIYALCTFLIWCEFLISFFFSFQFWVHNVIARLQLKWFSELKIRTNNVQSSNKKKMKHLTYATETYTKLNIFIIFLCESTL